MPSSTLRYTVAHIVACSLDSEIFIYSSHLFAESTKQSYTTHRDTYLRFCRLMGYDPILDTSQSICQYATFLACSLTFSSINNYLHIIGLIHKKFGLPNPLTDSWQLTSLLRGIRRVKGDTVKQKLPITLRILRLIHSRLNLNCSLDSSFWAICLTAFFVFFRKTHLLTKSKTTFDPEKQFTKSNFRIFSMGHSCSSQMEQDHTVP